MASLRMCSAKVRSHFSVGRPRFMDDTVVSNEGVTKLLKCLNPPKALGPDELHPRILQELATELGPVFPISSKSLLTRVKSPKNGLL